MKIENLEPVNGVYKLLDLLAEKTAMYQVISGKVYKVDTIMLLRMPLIDIYEAISNKQIFVEK